MFKLSSKNQSLVTVQDSPDTKAKNEPAGLSSSKAFLIISLLGIIVFFNGLNNDFLGDDNDQIVNNPLVQSLDYSAELFKGSTFYIGNNTIGGSYYRPITQFSFALVNSLFKASPFAFHLFLLTIHIVNAFLIYLILSKFFIKHYALVLSLIFLVHPINSEVVYYISNTQEALFMLFGLLGLLTLMRAQQWWLVITSALLFLLSLFSKETGILFIFASFLYLIIYARKKIISFSTITIPALILYLYLKITAVGLITNTPISQIQNLDFWQRLFNMPLIALFYLKAFIFPVTLSHAYRWTYTDITLKYFFAPLIICAVILSLLIYIGFKLYKKHRTGYFRAYVFFSIWTLLGIGFHLQIIPLDFTVSERWFYFPIIGVLGIIGIGLEYFRVSWKNSWVLASIVLLLFLLSSRTFIRGFDWQDNLTLSYQNIKTSNDDYVAENYIGNELLKQGDLDKAKEHIDRSIKIFPFYTNYNTLGLYYLSKSDYSNAKEAYLTGLKYGDYLTLYENLATLTLVHGETNQNIDFLKNSSEKFPNSSKILLCLAIQEYEAKKIDDAKKTIQRAYQLDKQNRAIIEIYQKIYNNLPLNIEFDPRPE